MVPLLIWMAAFIADGGKPHACDTPAAIIDDAKVIEEPADPGSLALTLQERGLVIRQTISVSWPTCPVEFQFRVYGDSAVTSNGFLMTPVQGRILIRTGQTHSFEPEPAHPELHGAIFVSSTNLFAGGRRLGIWQRPDETSLIASYNPGNKTAPHVIVTSSQQVLGVYYLPRLHMDGGQVSFWQKLGPSNYRFVRLSWDEAGLR